MAKGECEVMAKKDRSWFQVDSIITLICRVQEYFLVNLSNLISEFEELRRLAEIGRATEFGFKQGYSFMKDEGDFVDEDDLNETYYEFDLKTIANNLDELLVWAKETNNGDATV